MKACYYCGKKAVFGRSHTHHRGVAGGRWKKRAQKTRRIFKPNLQKVEILEKGKPKKVYLCSKCLKRVRKDISEGKKPFLQLSDRILKTKFKTLHKEKSAKKEDKKDFESEKKSKIKKPSKKS